jgi:glycosyltransferase involved in cell wall biosynthesis
MKISLFTDSKFITDGNGNYFTSSNVRKALLYPIAEKFERVYIVCRLRETSLQHVPKGDVICHPKIQFLGVSYFRGILGRYLNRHHIQKQIAKALKDSDVCVLRGGVVSQLSSPLIQEYGLPSIGHVLGEFGMEIAKHPNHVPVPGLRKLIAKFSRSLDLRTFQSCDIHCGVSPMIASKYAPEGRPVHQLVNSCLDESSYQKPERNERKDITAIFAGRLEKFKNVQTFLQAVALLKSKNIMVQVLIIGDGTYHQPLKQLAKELAISHQIEFTGRIESREELASRYRSSDIGFMLSLSEGLGLSALETMAVGSPVVGANLGYLDTLISDGVEGFLIDPENVEQAAEKVEFLAMNPHKRYEMGMMAYKKAKQFSSESQAQKLYDLASQVVERKN